MQVHIVLLTSTAVYLLLLEYQRLVNFFFITQSNLPQFNFRNSTWKNVLRFSVIYVPVILLIVCKRYPRNYPELFGKYEVENYSWGNQTHINRPTECDSVLTKIYIDSYAVVLEYNQVRRRLYGEYQYDRKKHTIKALYNLSKRAKNDTLLATISEGKYPGFKILTGRMGNNKFLINMKKLEY